MQRIAVYGKGGVGKSVVATSLSSAFALAGKKVLHVGCDPKHDSAVRLMEDGRKLVTVLDALADDATCVSTENIIHRGRHGIDCCESGGPQPGLGCGGRGVARTLEFLDEMDVMASGAYEVVIFDVLGDVVCGGFAAPLRRGFAEKVIIVISEEPMALFAANNIARAILVYNPNGVVLAGLVASLRSPTANREFLERFAQTLSTPILAYIPRDPLITSAERACMTVVEASPDSDSAKAFLALASTIESLEVSTIPLPTPLTDDAFFEFIRE